MQNVGVLFISPHISLYVLNDVIPQVIMLNKSTARASNQVAFFFHKNAVSIFTNMFCVDSVSVEDSGNTGGMCDCHFVVKTR